MQFSAEADVEMQASTIATQTGRFIALNPLCPAHTENCLKAATFRDMSPLIAACAPGPGDQISSNKGKLYGRWPNYYARVPEF